VEAFPDIKNYKTRKELEAILMEMRQPDDKGSREEENFAEAKRNLLKSMGRTKVFGQRKGIGVSRERAYLLQ
jgi:hypothetical protein